MRKFIYLAIAAVATLFVASCGKDSDGYEWYTWEYSFEVTEDGGMSEEDLRAIEAAFNVAAPELTFEASVSDAEKFFESVMINLRMQFDPIIGSIQHTSDIVITVTCTSTAGSFQDVIVIE